MTLKNEIDPQLEKYVSRLQEPAKRSKKAVEDALEKSLKRFQDLVVKSESDEEKSLLLKKVGRISGDLNVLKVLTEDDIVRYALLKFNKIMTVASNLRVPREERMKARVAAHKPLSSHLSRVKQKILKAEENTETELDNDGDSVPTLDKITFNNTVVLMRKDVKRAKVFIIHKLTRTIKKLRESKGKEEKVVKLKRKADRLHKKIIHIKELDEDEISKFALSTTQNINQLATDIKAPSTSQALATVALHEFVAAHVRAFKQKYPDWQKVVPNLLKKKRKKRKLNLDSNNDNEKTSKKLSKNTTESENSQSENENSQSENENSQSENDNSQSENENSPSESENESSKRENGYESDNLESGVNQESEAEDDKPHEGDSLHKSVDELPNTSDRKVQSLKILKNKTSKEIKISKENSRKIQKLSKESTKKHFTKNNQKTKESSPQTETKPIEDKPKVIDPFFVTATNENYVTSQIPTSGENESYSGEKEHVKQDRFKMVNDSSHKNKWERSGSEGKYGKINRFQASAPFKKHNSGSFDRFHGGPSGNKLVFGNRKERRKALLQPQVEEKIEKLHPSWEAKKKHSSIIPFQGKKVTFD